MKYYQMLNNKFNSDERNDYGRQKDPQAEIYISRYTLKDCKKIMPQFQPDDWKQIDINLNEKSIDWKVRFAKALQFAKLELALPYLKKLHAEKDSRIRESVIQTLDSEKFKKEITEFSLEDKTFFEVVIEDPLLPKINSEIPDHLKKKIHGQKRVGIDGLLLWRWKKWDGQYLCCFAGDKAVASWTEHIQAFIDLAEHFGESHCTYLAIQPRDTEKHRIGSAFFLKSLCIHIYDESKSLNREKLNNYEIDSDKAEARISIGLEMARETVLTIQKRKNLWMEPPYIGWEIFCSNDVYLLPSLPDSNGEWAKK